MYRRGVTLIECLVAIAIIGLLMAIVLPAVQTVRESARRLDCAQRQRQLITAVMNSESTYGSLPLAGKFYSPPPHFRQMLSVWAKVTPYLDLADLYRTIDQSAAEDGVGAYFPGPPQFMTSGNRQLRETTIPVLLCPSDRKLIGGVNQRVCDGTFSETNSNPSHPADGGRRGCLDGRMGEPMVRDITDGVSNTVLVSERVVGDFDLNKYTPFRDVFYLTDGTYFYGITSPDEIAWSCQNRFRTPMYGEMSYMGGTWLVEGKVFTLYDHNMTPNSPIPDCSTNGRIISPGAVAARSQHPGGVNAGYADGAVKFCSNAIDLTLWRALATRSGGENNR